MMQSYRLSFNLVNCWREMREVGFWLLRHAPERGLHAVCYSRRQVLGPLIYRLVCDANCIGSGGDSPAQQFNGFSFKHGRIEPQFNSFVNPGSAKYCKNLNHG